MIPAATAVRFFGKVDITKAGCWTWNGATAGEGYGAFWVPDVGVTYAHRVSHGLFIGPIPEGLEVDHLCRNRLCVNPTHLEAVTGDENKRRARERAGVLDHCANGHPFDDINTYVSPKGYRACRACERARRREYRARKKAS